MFTSFLFVVVVFLFLFLSQKIIVYESLQFILQC